MTTLLAFLFVLGVLIFFHELGHFSVAKLSGVGVEVFSLGFGPRLAGFKIGTTDYRLCAIPFGGYVKMVGDDPADLENQGRTDGFLSATLPRRAAIVLAGPVMNLLLALVLAPLIFVAGVDQPKYLEEPAVVAYIDPGSAFEKAGVVRGDTILHLGDADTPTWQMLVVQMQLMGETPGAPLTVRRSDGRVEQIKIDLPPFDAAHAAEAGIYHPMPLIVGRLMPGSAAVDAKLESDDEILLADGVSLKHWLDLTVAVQQSQGKAMQMQVRRKGELLSVDIVPRFNEEAQRWLLGIDRKEVMVRKQYPIAEAIGAGWNRFVHYFTLSLDILHRLLTFNMSVKSLGGPIMIAQVSGQAAAAGLGQLLQVMVFISLQLGILNLLPIPVLDGGHLLFFGIEAIRGKRLSDRVMERAQQVGLAMLIALMVVATSNDILRTWGESLRGLWEMIFSK